MFGLGVALESTSLHQYISKQLAIQGNGARKSQLGYVGKGCMLGSEEDKWGGTVKTVADRTDHLTARVVHSTGP